VPAHRPLALWARGDTYPANLQAVEQSLATHPLRRRPACGGLEGIPHYFRRRNCFGAYPTQGASKRPIARLERCGPDWTDAYNALYR